MGIVRATEVTVVVQDETGKKISRRYFWNGVGWCCILNRHVNLGAHGDLSNMGQSCGGVRYHLQLTTDDAMNIIRGYGLQHSWGENLMEVLRVSPERLEHRATEHEPSRSHS